MAPNENQSIRKTHKLSPIKIFIFCLSNRQNVQHIFQFISTAPLNKTTQNNASIGGKYLLNEQFLHLVKLFELTS